MASIVGKTGKFFQNVAREMKKVRWPTRKELVSYTITVIITVLFISVFFALVDLAISEIIRWILG